MILHTRFAVSALLLALLTACAPRGEPAEVIQHGMTAAAVATMAPHPSARPAAATAPMSRPGATVVVSRGETLSAIARRHGTDAATIARLNGLKPPYGVQAGQKLTLPDAPQPAVAAVRPVPAAPAAQNQKTKPGDSLKPLAVRAAPIPPPAAEPISQTTVTSAPRSGVQSAPLAAPEPVKAPPTTLKIEASKPEPVQASMPVVARAEPPAPVVVARAELQSPASLPAVIASEPPASRPSLSRSKPVIAAEPEARITPAAFKAPPPKTSIDEPPPRSGRHFQWPVKGRMISSYGPQPGGLRNDGFNIAASRGSNVVAADNGVVAYAGDDLKGFGNLVLIKHAGGFVTTYAHNEKLLVKRGDRVRRGQVVATVGDSGSVTQPQVHFQIRQGAHAVDPRPLMERSS